MFLQCIVYFLFAVKAGGMRIVQHKTPNNERAAKDPVEIVGLSQPGPNIQGDVVLSSSPNSNHQSIEASQAAHHHKPPQSIPNKPMNNIQQPRK